jgi:aminopeptidase N
MSEVKTIKLSDYKEPTHTIDSIYLIFELDNSETIVKNRMHFTQNGELNSLTLFAHNLQLKSISLNGKPLDESEYKLNTHSLTLVNLPEKGFIDVVNTINPEANKTLEGLYKSGGIFCTQCEPEGFRAITFYPDRPDVMTKFTTKVIADKKSYPTLLSNGNPIERGDLEGGKHYVIWEDPFAKPSYLFALVAGDLGMISDTYITGISKREIKLEIYCDKGNEDKCHHALESLKNSMRWDEERFGLEYDLDIYMIVAVDSFNMGAMENKGLNIFNSKYVLAKQETATDQDFLGVEGVIGHEYFHNWTGNRVTCKNWFQLTLKEGLTVFRDQEFSSDMMKAPAVKRIEDVLALRQAQFVEDAGPTAHPIKPKEYIEMNNFYTATVYEKGAEIIRMIETFLGGDGFRKGMDLYFERHDGQAVTTEDFVAAMSDANGGYDFEQFKTWYDRAGTPHLYVETTFDQNSQTYSMHIKQECIETKGVESTPFHLPLKMGLLNPKGGEFALELDQSDDQPQLEQGILHIRKSEETFLFKNIDAIPYLSLNRGFKAPVIIHYDNSLEELSYLSKNDSDDFNRYEAIQELSKRVLMQMYESEQIKEAYVIPHELFSAFEGVLNSNIKDAIKAYCLQVPSIALLKISYEKLNFLTLAKVRKELLDSLAVKFQNKFKEIYNDCLGDGEFSIDADSIGQRMLKNRALSYLSLLEENLELVHKQFMTATNMTDEYSALVGMSDYDDQKSSELVNSFLTKWSKEKLVVDKWFVSQAQTCRKDTLEIVESLVKHELFDITNPNSVRAVVGTFCANYAQFHHESGKGYEFAIDMIIKLDRINPQVASRLIMGFRDFSKLEGRAKELMEAQLQRLKATENLSKNTLELLNKILA